MKPLDPDQTAKIQATLSRLIAEGVKDISSQDIAAELQVQGVPISTATVGETLRKLGYTTQTRRVGKVIRRFIVLDTIKPRQDKQTPDVSPVSAVMGSASIPEVKTQPEHKPGAYATLAAIDYPSTIMRLVYYAFVLAVIVGAMVFLALVSQDHITYVSTVSTNLTENITATSQLL